MSLEWLPSALVGLEFEFYGGANEEAIRAASNSINLPFPPGYVEFLRRYGSGFISYQELIGLGGPAHLDVAQQTAHLRTHSRVSPFPLQLIPLLADGYGNYECLDASSKDSAAEFPVVQWLHDGGDQQALTTLALSYEDWLRDLVRQIRAVETGDQQKG